MRFLTLNGKIINKNYHKYLIDWNKEECSKFQTKVKKFLEPYLKYHIVYSEFLIPGTKMRIDIFDATTRIAYEISGKQHLEYTPFFHQNPAKYLSQIKRDFKKIKFCEINNIKLIEIYEKDILSVEYFKEKFGLVF